MPVVAYAPKGGVQKLKRTSRQSLTGRLESRSELIRIAASPLSGCKADTFDPERIIFRPHPGRPLLPALKVLQRLRGDTFQRFARFVRLPEIGERRGYQHLCL